VLVEVESASMSNIALELKLLVDFALDIALTGSTVAATAFSGCVLRPRSAAVAICCKSCSKARVQNLPGVCW
jgi:hypothetical protein